MPLEPAPKSLNWEVRAYGYQARPVKGNSGGGRAQVVLDDGPIVSGVVLSFSGKPLENALVLTGCRAPGGRSWTDSRGRFSSNTGCSEELFLEVRCPGYITKGLRLTADAPKENLVIRLADPEGGVTGWVLHADGLPVTRFMLQFDNGDPENPFFINPSFADPAGRFAVLDLPAGKLEMEVTEADDPELHTPAETFQLEIRKGMIYSDLVIRLKDQPIEVSLDRIN